MAKKTPKPILKVTAYLLDQLKSGELPQNAGGLVHEVRKQHLSRFKKELRKKQLYQDWADRIQSWTNEGLFKLAPDSKKRVSYKSPAKIIRAWILIDLKYRNYTIEEMPHRLEQLPQPLGWKKNPVEDFREQFLIHTPGKASFVRHYVLLRPIIRFLNAKKYSQRILDEIFEETWGLSAYTEAERTIMEMFPGTTAMEAAEIIENDWQHRNAFPLWHVLDPTSKEVFFKGIQSEKLFMEKQQQLLTWVAEFMEGKAKQPSNMLPRYQLDKRGHVKFEKSKKTGDQSDAVPEISLINYCYTHLWAIRQDRNDRLKRCRNKKCQRFFFPSPNVELVHSYCSEKCYFADRVY